MQHRGGEGRAGRFWPSGSKPTASHGARAPQALLALVGALGSTREDLRRHGICALVAMAGSAACATTMGDGWTARERVAQVSGRGARRGQR
jgi:hypothetical protein